MNPASEAAEEESLNIEDSPVSPVGREDMKLDINNTFILHASTYEQNESKRSFSKRTAMDKARFAKQ